MFISPPPGISSSHLIRGIYFGMERENATSEFKWLDGTTQFDRAYEPSASFLTTGHRAVINPGPIWGSFMKEMKAYRLCEKPGSGRFIIMCKLNYVVCSLLKVGIRLLR